MENIYRKNNIPFSKLTEQKQIDYVYVDLTNALSFVEQVNHAAQDIIILYAGKGKGKGKKKQRKPYMYFVGEYIEIFGVCEDPNNALGWAISCHSYALGRYLSQ